MTRNLRFLQTNHHRTRGQSLVELAIVLMLLMLLLVGIVEYGFLLNQYLNLVDATREAARSGSNSDPFKSDGSLDMNFFVRPNTSMPVNSDPNDPDYNPAGLADLVEDFLGNLTLDPALNDDIVISFFSVDGDGDVVRFPTTMPTGYSRFSTHVSNFTNAEIEALVDSTAPATGVLLIEIFYNYPQTLNMPLVSTLFNDNHTIPVFTYAIMPLSSAEPTPTPSP